MKKTSIFQPRAWPRAKGLVLGLTVFGLAASSWAANGTWTNLLGGSWATAVNWSNSVIATGIGSTADFSQLTLGAARTVTLDGAETNGNLIFGDLGNTYGWTLSAGTGGTLTLTNTAGTSTITVNGQTNTISLVLTGTNGLVKLGAGYLLLSGADSYVGATTVSNGTLEVTADSGAKVYTSEQGATLKIGYSVAAGNYSYGVTVNGNGVSDSSGFYIKTGQSLDLQSTLTLQGLPSIVRVYGGAAAGSLIGWDISGTHLSVAASASGSVLDTNVNLVCSTYGYRMSTTSGTNTVNGDVAINGVISGTATGVSVNGIEYCVDKVGTGSVLLTNASTYLPGMYLSAGTIILSGANNRLPAGSGLALASGATLRLNGISQTFTNVSGGAATSGGAVVGGSATASTLVINDITGTNTFAGTLGGTTGTNQNLALTKTGAGRLVLSGPLLYTNNTTISAGTVLAGSLTNADGATLSVVDAAGTLADTNLALGTSAGSTVSITGFAGATGAPIVATNLSVKGVATITLAGTFTTGQFPLIQFLSGTIGGGGAFTLQQAGLPRGVSAALVTNVPNNSVDVLLTANPLVWVGATNGVSTATWDDGVTTNWSLIGAPNYFTNNDNVQIDDTAIGSTTLTLATTVSPFTVLVTNNALNYTIGAATGAALTGSMALTKQGTGKLTLTSSNSFTGGVTIAGGAVNLQNGYAFNTNTVTVNAGAELEVQGGIAVVPVTTLALKSTGTNNTGGLRNISGNNIYGGAVSLSAPARINSDSGILTLTNGVAAGGNLLTLGGSGDVTVSTAAISGSAGLVKDGSGTNIWNIDPGITAGGITVNAGTFQINDGNFGGMFTPVLTVNSGATLWCTNTHGTGGDCSLVISNGTWLMSAEDYKQNLTLMDALITPGPNQLSAGADLRVGYAGSTGSWTWYVSNSVAGSVVNAKVNTVVAGVTNIWNVTRGAAASDLTINGVIYDPGDEVFTGNGITTLTATNTYTGFTLLSGGTLLLASTAVVPTNTVTVATNATLAGSGAVMGATTIQFGGTLAPGLGGLNTSSLTVSNSLSLAGNAQFVLDRTNAQNSSRVAGLGAVILGGTLTVSNAGPALQQGDTFTLFQATGGYTGGFTNLVLPTLTPPLVWGTASLPVNGSLTVQTATSLGLVSSENPSGYKDRVAFTGNLGVPATGTIVFQTNGVTFDTESVSSGSATSVALTLLPRGTNLVAAIYSGDVNYQGSSASLNQVVTNHPPVANALTVSRNAGVSSLKIALTDLATNWSDADGDTVSFVSAGTSTNGVNVTTNSGYVVYDNAANVNDQFSYTIADSYGGTNTGVVTIQVISTGVFGQTSPSIMTTGGAPTLSFAGIPGLSYSVQVSSNLTDWSTAWTTNAPANGLFQFTDSSPPQPTAFYRLQWNP